MIQGDASNVNIRRSSHEPIAAQYEALLPLLLNGPDLARECCGLEQRCWRELGYPQQPVFDGG